MSETYLDFCIRRPGPANKRGYFGTGPTRSLALVEGEAKHSAEGYKAAMQGIIADPNNEKSWPLSVYKLGPPEQHYPLEAICWINTGPMNNIKYIGMEHEGRVGEALTPSQVEWTIRISTELRRLCPKMAANPPARRVNLWEHREISPPEYPTACPSGRIPWQGIIAALQQEDVMNATQEAKLDRVLAALETAVELSGPNADGSTWRWRVTRMQLLEHVGHILGDGNRWASWDDSLRYDVQAFRDWRIDASHVGKPEHHLGPDQGKYVGYGTRDEILHRIRDIDQRGGVALSADQIDKIVDGILDGLGSLKD